MFRIVEKMNNHYTWSLELIRCWSDSDIPISHYASVSKNEYWIVIQKTRTVQVRVPYPHCTGAARTQILDSMDTNTLWDTQKIQKKKIFFS